MIRTHLRSYTPWNRFVVVFAAVVFVCLGCATPSRMQHSSFVADDRTNGEYDVRWWVLTDDVGNHSPIVAVEYRRSRDDTTQIVSSDRGVRRYTYGGDRLRSASAPLGGHLCKPELSIVRAALRQLRRQIVDSSRTETRVAPIPDERISGIDSLGELSALLDEYWPTLRVAPPPDLTYRAVYAELEHFPHGALELRQAADAF
jgi:hypothetical protein